MPRLEKLLTEQANPASASIDALPTEDVLRIVNSEDRKVAEAVERGLARRQAEGGEATTIINIDSCVNADVIKQITNLSGVNKVKYIEL